MEKFILKIVCALLLSISTMEGFAQTYHMTNVTVVYSNNQSDGYFENVTGFSFLDNDLLIHQNNSVIAINRSHIRKLMLEDVAGSSIETYNAESGIQVYPNPASNKLFFASEKEQQVDVCIYSLAGQLLRQSKVSTSDAIDVSSLSKGIYIIKINEISYKFSKL